MKSVYLIRGNDGKYKIGITKNLKKRLSQIQTGNPDELQLIYAYQSDNAQKIEAILHNHYAYGKQKGEWFDLSIAEESRFGCMCENLEKTLLVLKQMGNEFIK